MEAVEGFALLEASLAEVERTRPDGLSSGEILDLLGTHGVVLSEATLRKYVQLGLLPRSVRVGRKGKHKGSRGLYPVEVLRRVLFIKACMAESYTIEEIKQRLVFLSLDIDKLEADIRAVLSRVKTQEVTEIHGKSAKAAELSVIQRVGRELIARLRKLDRGLRDRSVGRLDSGNAA